MSEKTGIEWTDATWNPWHGCIKVSQGCKNCYMYREKKRYGQDPMAVTRSKTTFRDPLKWKDARRVFTCSWSDFFIDQADGWRAEAWDIIRQTPHLTYQILTKRPERIWCHLPGDWGDGYSNAWLGVSVESPEHTDRIDQLGKVPAAVRFLSLEPLLEDLGGINLSGINWVIVGGESGPNARPMHPAWVRSLRDQCQAAGVAFHFKQWGEWMPIFCGINPSGNDPKCRIHDGFTFPKSEGEEVGQHMWNVGKKGAGRLLDGRTWDEFPEVSR